MAEVKKNFVVMAGGTGGHVFPGLAVADELTRNGFNVEWLGTEKGMEFTLVPKRGYKIHTIKIWGLRGKGKLTLLLAPFKLVKAVWQAIKILRVIKPVGVLGMGGFVTGPGGVAAKILGIPVTIHEQNAIPGLTNKLLSKIANPVMEAFPGTFDRSVKALSVGNPVRADILSITDPGKRIDTTNSSIKLLVVGGSLGAKALNELMPGVIKSLRENKISQIQLRHQAGKTGIANTLKSFEQEGLLSDQVKVSEFIDDMAEAFTWADLVICRSGALTVTELSAAGVASILVPFPFAVDDHQTKNAEFLSTNGAAILIQQKELTESWLVEKIIYFINHKQELLHMAEKAKSLAKPDSTTVVAKHCMALNS